jgi:5-methylcytosine-specific restriction protein A
MPTTYILTWNPSHWQWKDYDSALEKITLGETYEIDWSSGNTKKIRVGDRLFILRQYTDRGVIAAGQASSECFQGKSWDGSGRDINYVRVRIEQLLPHNQQLPIEQLLSETSFTWNNMPASGMSLPSSSAETLEQLWVEHWTGLADSSKQPQSRNPTWQRDELILALDLYFRHPPKTISQSHRAVIELSEILNSLPIHPSRPDAKRFRNPNGVYMKLSNFLRFDPEYKGEGVSRGGKLEESIWIEFAADRDLLHQLAIAIKNGYSSAGNDIQLEDEDEVEFPEGRVLYRLHRHRERNPQLVKRKKDKAVTLACEVCGFDFYAAFGDLGRGYIECHHTQPNSTYDKERRTRLCDLVLVCSNCHRMLHRRRPWLSIQELGRLIPCVS